MTKIKQKTQPNVFIIESLKFEDEQNNRFEGKFLSQILHLGGKESAYYYVQTKTELIKALRIFKKSKFRYLHLSCHGGPRSISTTLDTISFSDFAELLQPYLQGKRLFVSACYMVNKDLADQLFAKTKCQSIIGPTKSIYINDAAIMWASFYHLVFNQNFEKMKKGNIIPALKSVVKTFGLRFNYFYSSKVAKKGYKNEIIS